MSFPTIRKSGDPKPGIFGAYFTPSKTTRSQEQLNVILLGTALIGSLFAIGQLKNEGLINDIVFTPIFEEILYRGVFTKMVDVGLNVFHGVPKTADQIQARKTARTVISALIFASLHTDDQILKFWLLGRTLGYLKEETGGYLLPIAFHMMNNASAQIEQAFLDRKFTLPIMIVIPSQLLALYLMDKNINPWTGLKETYRYFTKTDLKN